MHYSYRSVPTLLHHHEPNFQLLLCTAAKMLGGNLTVYLKNVQKMSMGTPQRSCHNFFQVLLPSLLHCESCVVKAALQKLRKRKLEAKAKYQGHSRKCSPKKSLQKSFSGNLHFFGAARIFDGGPKPQITCNDVIKDFQTRNFSWDKDIVGWKI